MSRDSADRAAAGLVASYGLAWQQIKQRQSELVTARNRARAARQLATDASSWMDDLDAQTRDWLENEWSLVYAQGAIDADREWEWNDQAVNYATQSADELFVSLYGATSGVVRTTARLASSTPWDSSTAASELADMLRLHGAAAVVYRNGSRHGLADYADMRIRTSVSLAYNHASVTAGKAAGAQWFDCADGFGCGVTSHEDPEKANGIIATAEFAFANPIAHPRCSRSWSPLYDIQADVGDAKNGILLTSGDAEAVAEAPVSRARDRLNARLSSRANRLATSQPVGS